MVKEKLFFLSPFFSDDDFIICWSWWQPKLFGFSGTKDKRAITTQQVKLRNQLLWNPCSMVYEVSVWTMVNPCLSFPYFALKSSFAIFSIFLCSFSTLWIFCYWVLFALSTIFGHSGSKLEFLLWLVVGVHRLQCSSSLQKDWQLWMSDCLASELAISGKFLIECYLSSEYFQIFSIK
jgi:hypothetical protein